MNAVKSLRPAPVSKMLALWTPSAILSVASGHAAADMYLKIEGISGESTTSSHKEWIEIQSFSWGASNSGMQFGSVGAGKVDITELSLSKRLDASSPALFLRTASGQPLGTVVFQMVRPETGVFYEIKMQNVIVTSVMTSGATGEDRPSESISLNFSKIEVGYAAMSSTGKLDSMVRVSWDIGANQGG
jgi:type VI secretion system secreted protein Hcp